MTLVMVVDDDQDLAEMLGIVLTGAGIDVDLVSRGDEVLDVCRNVVNTRLQVLSFLNKVFSS